MGGKKGWVVRTVLYEKKDWTEKIPRAGHHHFQGTFAIFFWFLVFWGHLRGSQQAKQSKYDKRNEKIVWLIDYYSYGKEKGKRNAREEDSLLRRRPQGKDDFLPFRFHEFVKSPYSFPS
jgi:hypothetical protein